MADFSNPDNDSLAYWLAFSSLTGTGLGFKKIQILHEHFQGLKEAWNASAKELQFFPWLNSSILERFIEQRNSIDPDNLMQKLVASGAEAFHYFSPSYPALLRQIDNPPLVLYAKGSFHQCSFDCAVGIVGTRKPTAYGEKLAKDLAKDLANAGVLVISGMAYGIDSLAHWGAIESDGLTVAVLGSGVDLCYPSSNKRLYKAITEEGKGAAVSEYFPGTAPQKFHFPARNRIISGLSKALAVVEAGDSSGSLITANIAFEQSREVFAIPGRIDSLMSVGTNDLIAKNIAHLLRDSNDILREMGWASKSSENSSATAISLQGREIEIYELMSNEPVQFDYLVEKTGMKIGELSAILTMLELAGVILRLPGDRYVREKQAFRV
jgi:DNA processing protein